MSPGEYSAEYIASTGNVSKNFKVIDAAQTVEAAVSGYDPADGKIYHTVTFETNTGWKTEPQKIAVGEKLVKPDDPIKLLDEFVGWYLDPEFTKAYDFNTPVKSDFTLYAKYKSDEGGSSDPGGTTSDIPSSVKVKEIVTFGNYPQTAGGKDNTPIEWIVLNKKGGKALLLSKYALDCQEYNSSFIGITWADCTLRKWLNSTFIDKAFNDSEKESIQLTNISNPDSYWGVDKTTGDWDVNNSGTETFDPDRSTYHVAGGENTQDKVFLLSIDEAKSLLGYERQTLKEKDGSTYTGYPNMQAACTDYAYSQGASRSSSHMTPAGEACWWWWLRSPGSDSYDAANVYYDGDVCSGYVAYIYGAVRPALWVNLAS